MVEYDQPQQSKKVSTSFKDGSVMVSSAMLPHRIRQKIVDKPSWFKSDDEYGWMTIDLSMPPNVLGFAKLMPDPSLRLTENQLREYQSVLDNLYRKMNDLTVDVADIIWSRWIENKNVKQNCVELWANDILLDRGFKPLPDGTFPTAYKMELSDHINILENLWIDVTCPVFEDKKGKTKKIYKRILGRYLLKESMMVDTEEGPSKIIPYGWRVAPGRAMQLFLDNPNKQFMLMTKEILSYHPTKQLVEKRLARHLMWQFRIRQAKGDYLRSFNNEKILTATSIKVDRRNPSRFRDRLEQAFDTLKDSNIISGWQYDSYWDEEVTKKRGWVEDWLSVNVIFEPPKEIVSFLDTIQPKVLIQPKPLSHTKSPDYVYQLKAILQSSGMTQLKLAEKLEVQPSYLSMLLREIRTNPSSELLFKIQTLSRTSNIRVQ